MVPLAYAIFLKKIKNKYPSEEIPVRTFRYILNCSFHLGKENLNPVINEMKKLNLIQYSDFKTIKINK